jgi:hypothetical protein
MVSYNLGGKRSEGVKRGRVREGWGWERESGEEEVEGLRATERSTEFLVLLIPADQLSLCASIEEIFKLKVMVKERCECEWMPMIVISSLYTWCFQSSIVQLWNTNGGLSSSFWAQTKELKRLFTHNNSFQTCRSMIVALIQNAFWTAPNSTNISDVTFVAL